MKTSDNSIELLVECLDVFNQVPRKKYWSTQQQRDSDTYKLASRIEEELEEQNE